MAVLEVHLLPLTDEGAPDVPGQYIYLPPPSDPPYIVRFAIEGTSSICRHGSLWVNIPARGEPFRRDRFREYKWVPKCRASILF
jgi:glycogen debranching enzyme